MRPEKRWAKTDPGLRSHPAFVDLVEELNSTPIMVDGMLHGLWSLAFFDAPDGDVSRFKPRALARAVGWRVPGTSGDILVKSLEDCGFLYRDGDRLLIHDWSDWGGALFSERRYETDKKAAQRKLAESVPTVPGTSPGLPPVSPGPSRVDLDLEELKPPTPLDSLTIKARAIPMWKVRDDDDQSFCTWRSVYSTAQIEDTICALLTYQAGLTNGKRYKDPRIALAKWLKRLTPENRVEQPAPPGKRWANFQDYDAKGNGSIGRRLVDDDGR
jgi:hypothetical protein